MLANATKLCEASFGSLFLREGDVFRSAARHLPTSSANIPMFQQGITFKIHENIGVPLVRMVETRSILHIADLRTDQSYIERNPRILRLVESAGARTFLGVPLLKDNELIGAFGVYRQEVRPFSEEQIALVKHFAAQAVIAIENTRLLNELRQSLERQTATSQVLQVISSSPDDLEPVFRTMLENATRICEAKFGVMQVPEGDGLRAVSFHDVPPAYAEAMRRDPVFRPNVGHPLERVASTKQVVHIADASAEQKMRGWIVELAGARTLLLVPMLKDNNLSA